MPHLNTTPTGMKVPVWIKHSSYKDFFFFQSNADIMSLCGWCLSDPERVVFHTHRSEGVVFLIHEDKMYATCRKKQCVEKAADGYKRRKVRGSILLLLFFNVPGPCPFCDSHLFSRPGRRRCR